MSDLLSSLDLKFLPDWLKESPAPNRYAGFEGDSSERRQEGRERFGRGQGGGGGGRGGGGGAGLARGRRPRRGGREAQLSAGGGEWRGGGAKT